MDDTFIASNDYGIRRNQEKIEGLLKVIEDAVHQIKLANNGSYSHVHAAHCVSQMAIDLLKASVELEQQSKIRAAYDYATQLN